MFQFTVKYCHKIFSGFVLSATVLILSGCKANTETTNNSVTLETVDKFQAESYKKTKTRQLLPFCEAKNKCGYLSPAGNIEIPAKFQQALRFDKSGLAPIKVSGKWGYINQTGKVVIPPVFSLTTNFRENGLAIVGNGKKNGLINLDGEIVLEIKYDRIFPDDSKTEMRGDNFRDRMRIKQGKKWGYIDKAGKVVIPPKFKKVNAFSENGLALFKSKGKYGFINKSGEVVIPATFQLARDFDRNGLAKVADKGKFGFIDKSGKFVIPAVYNKTGQFNSDGLCPVNIGHKTGYINTHGKMIVKPKFNYLVSDKNTQHGLIPTTVITDLNSKTGYTNTKGKMVIPARFDYAKGFSLAGVAAVRNNKKWGLINRKGKYISSTNFDSIHGPKGTGGLLTVKKDGKLGVMSPNGNLKIPVKFDIIRIYQSYSVTPNYFVNYDYYPAYYKNYAEVRFGDKIYPVNLNGKPIGFNYVDVGS